MSNTQVITPAPRLFWHQPLRFVGTTTEPATGETFPVFVDPEGYYLTPDPDAEGDADPVFCNCSFGDQWSQHER